MKTIEKMPIADPGCAGGFAEAGCRMPIEKSEDAPSLFQIVNRKSKIVNGFTLVELLTVISIIGLLAAFTFPVLTAITKNQKIRKTQAEMGQLQAAIEAYKEAYGFYPPSNPSNPLGNQLYYELEGTTNNGTSFITLDGADSIKVNDVSNAFPGVGGFVNCDKASTAEDTQRARNFIHELRPDQLGTETNAVSNVGFRILVGSVGGPDINYQPLNTPNLNPWRYVAPGTNNPASYDLWIQLVIGRKTNLVCNWTKQVQVNNPLP